MKARIAIALGALAAVGLAVVAVRAMSNRPKIQGPSAQPAPACLTLARACPEVLPHVALRTRWRESHLGLLLVPPPAGVDPAIGAVRAIDVAWRGGGLVGRSQQAILALAPEGDLFPKDTLVWVIRYDGPCEAPPGAPFVKRGDCSLEPHFTMIDAETGDFLLTWTRPPGS